MSTIGEAVNAIREAIKLVDDVKRISGTLSGLATEVKGIDLRLARLEGKFEGTVNSINAALLISQSRNSAPQARRLPPGEDQDEHQG